MSRHIVRLATGMQFAADDDESLLAAAQRAHWLVRYGCRNGNCQACAATLLEGCVVQRDGTRITASHAAGPATQACAQEILLCSCRAQGDLQIALPGDPLHGSSDQARRHYARIDSVQHGADATALHITLPAGRGAPIHPGQYMLIERDGDMLRADIDTTASSGRNLRLLCSTPGDFAAGRHLTAIGPLGYCYAAAPASSVLILRDAPQNLQARLLKCALPAATVRDAQDIERLDAGASFDTVLACSHQPPLAKQWYLNLLQRGIVFDEFRTDDSILYRWRVWRQDDNANRFALSAALSEEAARRQVAEFERRGHKQLYWAEPMTPGIRNQARE